MKNPNHATSLDPYIESFEQSFAARNYKPATLENYRHHLRRFGRLLEAESIAPSELTVDRVSEATQMLFERHQALFCDKEDDDGVFPRIQKGRDEKFVHDMFDSFYAMNVTYCLADQWIEKPGPFTYDLAWLSSSGSVDDMKGFANRHFKMVFGVHPDEVEILPENIGSD